MANKLKPLHLAKSMKELNALATKNKLSDSTPRMLSKSSEKLYLGAYDKFLEGDQEQSYVLLLRYLDVVQAIRSSNEYKQNKKLVDKNKFVKALDDAEKLSKELSERYEKLSEEMEVQVESESVAHAGNDISISGDGFVSCETLYNLITSRPNQVLVVDCRKRSHMMSSSVNVKKCPQWLSIPQEVIKNGNLTAFLNPNQEKIWSERGKNGRQYVVLVDSSCELGATSSITLMKTILEKDKGSNIQPLVLDGGYNRWYLSYSPLCIGKWAQKDSNKERKTEKETDMESVAYPSSETLVPPKPKDLPEDNKIPFDGSTPAVNERISPNIPPQVSSSRSPPSHDQFYGEAKQNIQETNYTPISSSGVPSTIPLLPAVPSVNLPLQLEGHDFILRNDMQTVQPLYFHQNYYLDTEFYSGTNDELNPFQSYYDSQQVVPSAPLMEGQGDQENYHHHYYHHYQTGEINDYDHQKIQQVRANREEDNMHADPYQPQPGPFDSQMGHHHMFLSHPLNQLDQHGGQMGQNISANFQPSQPVPQEVQESQYTSGVQTRHYGIVESAQQLISGTQQPQIGNGSAQPGNQLPPKDSQSPHHVYDGTQPSQTGPPNGYGYTQPDTKPSHDAYSGTQSGPQTGVGGVKPHVPVTQPIVQLPHHHAYGGAQLTHIESHLPSQLPQSETQLPQSGTQLTQSGAQLPQSGAQSLQLGGQLPQSEALLTQSGTKPTLSNSIEGQPSQSMGLVNSPEMQVPSVKAKSSPDSKLQKSQLEQMETGRLLAMENELNMQREKIKKESEDQMKVTQEQFKLLMEEEHRKLAEEREKMHEQIKLTLERERKRDKEDFELARKEMQEQMDKKIQEVKDMYEKEKSTMMKNQEEMKHYWQMTRQQESNRQLVTSAQGLPPGWEKRLDRTTGRFYYVDHASKTTHWNPPTSLLQYQAEMQRQKADPPAAQRTNATPSPIVQQHKLPPSQGPSQPPNRSTGGRDNQSIGGGSGAGGANGGSGSGPGGANGGSGSGRDRAPVATPPTVSRADKPISPSPSVPTVDRSSKPNKGKPPMSVDDYRRKMNNLQPVLGSSGPGLTGLRNLGNTCFMNSVIQCVFATPPLMYYFVSNRYRTELNVDNPLGSGGKLAEEFFILCRAMWVERFKQIAPCDFKSMIDHVAPYFSGYQQHDCQEFLMYFLDGLHEDLNRVKVKKYMEMPEATGVRDDIAAHQAWDAHKKRNNSIIIDLFYGILKSTIRCLSCYRQKVMFEPFLSLSVPIPHNRSSCSYTDCLKLFSAVERLSGENKWFCPQCKQLREAEKSLYVWSLPPVLLLHFKRFKDGRGTVREKISTHISFPIENLNLDHVMVGPKPNKPYNLYAISNHIGGLGSGHYTACCKNAHDGQFYVFNDENVRQANSKDLSSSSSYLLFYTCQDFKSLKL